MAKTEKALTEIKPGINRVVRVAVNTNFYCTKPEWKQLDKLNEKHSESTFFVNCNINTPNLVTINDHNYKAVITANPNFSISHKSLQRFYRIDQEKIAFVRVKYIPTMQENKDLIKTLADKGYTVVITAQRWNGRKSLIKYTEKEHYVWSHNRFRLNKKAMEKLCSFADNLSDMKVFICDRIGGGCSTCKLCSFLPAGYDLKIASVDLSNSGICRFNCPDCYAHTMQTMAVGMGNNPIIFDKIRANTKQSGRSDHIKQTIKELLNV